MAFAEQGRASVDGVVDPPALSLEPTAARDRILRAAASLTIKDGWNALTMRRVAERAGVSRQTVYNEVGTKPALAEAIVRHELVRYLDIIVEAFARHPADMEEAVYETIDRVLRLSANHPLLAAALSTTSENDLLPLLTTDSAALINLVKSAVTYQLRRFDLPHPPWQVDAAVDLVVRATLSHVLRPGAGPATTARGIAWAVSAILAVPVQVPAELSAQKGAEAIPSGASGSM